HSPRSSARPGAHIRIPSGRGGLRLNRLPRSADDSREPPPTRSKPLSPADPERYVQPPSRSFRWRERERTEADDDLASWCAEAARLLHMARRLGAAHADTRALQRRLVPELVLHVQRHGPLQLDVTPRSIVMGDETVFAADHSNAPTGERALERELSWALHRDGLRRLRLDPGLTEAEAATFLDVLVLSAPADATHDDLLPPPCDTTF